MRQEWDIHATKDREKDRERKREKGRERERERERERQRKRERERKEDREREGMKIVTNVSHSSYPIVAVEGSKTYFSFHAVQNTQSL